MTKRIAVLVSGRGSNLQALLHAQAEGRLGGRIALVLSDKPNCLGIKRAREAGCETFTFSPKEFSDRESYERVMAREIESRECVLIVLAGFMRILTPWFVKRFEGRLINLHPALLPQFPGTHAIERAFAAGVRETGCTVHYVDAGVDTGEIIAQEKVPVNPEDTLESLAERIHEAEHRLLPQVVANLLKTIPERES